jgi:hypothetical protein
MTTTNRLIDLRTKLWPLSNDQSTRMVQVAVKHILRKLDQMHADEMNELDEQLARG